MSTTTKKESTKGIRYTDAQKKEVVDFTVSYNAANGRGGQSKAAEKFNVSQLTISGWLKAAGGSSSKAAKATKAPKAPKAPKAVKEAKVAGGNKLGLRYTPEQKKEVTEFVVAYNETNGRGGPSKASKKFGVSPLTVVAWLKAAGANVTNKGSKKGNKYVAPGKTSKVVKTTNASMPAVSGGVSAKLTGLLALINQIADAEVELVQLRAEFSALKASL